MTERSSQVQALSTSVGYRSRPDLLVVNLEGDDQRSWLNGQVTGDVRNTAKGDSVYCLAVNVRGRIMADIWVLDLGEHLSLLIPRSASEMLLASFESQIIMEDVEVVTAPSTHVISLLGPRATELVESISSAERDYFPGDELGDGGVWLLSEESEHQRDLSKLATSATKLGGSEVGVSAYELRRIEQRIPAFPDDFGLKSYPQEAGLKDRAVAFNKGCYLGQEVVCTLENRGKLARTLCALTASSSISAGAELTASDGTTIGLVTSSAPNENNSQIIALGHIKRAYANPGDAIRCGTATVTIAAIVGS